MAKRTAVTKASTGRKSAKRDSIDIGAGKRSGRRSAGGGSRAPEDAGKSPAANRRKKAKTEPAGRGSKDDRPNPSYEAVASQIVAAIHTGSHLPIDGDAAKAVLVMFATSIKGRLGIPGTCSREGENVLLASRNLGAIAAAIAELHHDASVLEFAIQDAARIVQVHCDLAYESGRWCDVDS